MKALFYRVQAGKPAYTRTLTCKETGVKATVVIPMDITWKDELINRVSEALATVEYNTIQVEEDT